jgi:hypothetical protein
MTLIFSLPLLVSKLYSDLKQDFVFHCVVQSD